MTSGGHRHGAGRPAGSTKSNKRTIVKGVRFTETEWNQVSAAVAEYGGSKTGFMRMSILEKAKEVLKMNTTIIFKVPKIELNSTAGRTYGDILQEYLINTIRDFQNPERWNRHGIKNEGERNKKSVDRIKKQLLQWKNAEPLQATKNFAIISLEFAAKYDDKLIHSFEALCKYMGCEPEEIFLKILS